MNSIYTVELDPIKFEKLKDSIEIPQFRERTTQNIRSPRNMDYVTAKFQMILYNPSDSTLFIVGTIHHERELNNEFQIGRIMTGQMPEIIDIKKENYFTFKQDIETDDNGKFQILIKLEDQLRLFYSAAIYPSNLEVYNIYKLLLNYNEYVKLNSDEILLQDSCMCIKDSLNAVQFAKKEFVKVYGADVLKQEPFVAVLRGSIWYVEGTFPYNTNSLPSSESVPDSIDSNGTEYYSESVAVGGVAYIKIDKKTCQIIEINHGE